MKRYESLNGVRTIACIGIVMMHILSNAEYNINANVASVISRFTDFVFLFIILSAFSMCCGYFEKIKESKISVEDFYKRRIVKIIPFFAFLVLLDIVVSFSKVSIIEGFADITLLFGFIPKELSVIGVGWFIGLIFIFYIMFPFFVFLFSTPKRAWLTTIMAVMMNVSCIYYFELGRTNMFYSFLFFCIGGLMYLYRENIIRLFTKSRVISVLLLAISAILFCIPQNSEYIAVIQIILFSFMFISYAISFDKSILNTKISSCIGKIGLEIYLSHMLVFRIFEKAKVTIIISNSYFQYILTITLVLIGTVVIAELFRFGQKKIEEKVVNHENTSSK